MKYLLGIPLIAGIGGVIMNFILAGVLALTYTNLTEEEPIVTIQFSQIKGKNHHIAILKDNLGNKIGKYEIYADQWRLDAQFYKMKYFAGVIGISSKYALDRFEGRYKNIDDANTRVETTFSARDTWQTLPLDVTYVIITDQQGHIALVRETDTDGIAIVEEDDLMESVKHLLRDEAGEVLTIGYAQFKTDVYEAYLSDPSVDEFVDVKRMDNKELFVDINNSNNKEITVTTQTPSENLNIVGVDRSLDEVSNTVEATYALETDPSRVYSIEQVRKDGASTTLKPLKSYEEIKVTDSLVNIEKSAAIANIKREDLKVNLAKFTSTYK